MVIKDLLFNLFPLRIGQNICFRHSFKLFQILYGVIILQIYTPFNIRPGYKEENASVKDHVLPVTDRKTFGRLNIVLLILIYKDFRFAAVFTAFILQSIPVR